ncbi:hypothetical protein [Halomonas sp. H10-9-1]|uniref:hypothetical protein n=1 Tax=Halomonas sp. H10-9-1 TaxID=2950871 RepID=UPI0032E04C51
MLIVCRTKAPRRGLTVTGSQHHRTRRVAMHEQTGHRRRPMPLWLAMADMHSAVETESEVKKCSLTAIGKVSTPASRIQEKTPKNTSTLPKYAEAIQECMMLYWKNPERYVVNLSTADPCRESVFDHVAPKYGLAPKTLFNRYNDELDSELKARLAKRGRERRRNQ